ncbi:DUF4160 domain-containing protein [Agrobacterium sp. rho-8.1]
MTVCISISRRMQDELEQLLRPVSEQGYIIKHMVALVDHRLKVEIRANEHPPPHFHVIYDGEDASFTLDTCTRLKGVRGLERHERVIRLWWQKNKAALAVRWNECRPENCPVGTVEVPQSK